MSVIRFTSMKCDHCGHESQAYIQNPTETKKQLRTEGWRFRNGIHRCPSCVANVQSESEATAS